MIAGSTYFSGRLLLLRLLLSRVEVRLLTDELVRGRSRHPSSPPEARLQLGELAIEARLSPSSQVKGRFATLGGLSKLALMLSYTPFFSRYSA